MRKITAKDIVYHFYDEFDDIDDYFYRNLYPTMIYEYKDFGETSIKCCNCDKNLNDIVPRIKIKTTYKELFSYLENAGFKIVKERDMYYIAWPDYDNETKEWKWEE